jgi:hypothetical protein
VREPELAAGPVERVSPRGKVITEWIYDVDVAGLPELSEEHDAARWAAASGRPVMRLTESAAAALAAG